MARNRKEKSLAKKVEYLETNATLQINYTSIKKRKKNK